MNQLLYLNLIHIKKFLATVKEQEAWSDRATSPSVHSEKLDSPIPEVNQIDNQSMLPPLLSELDKVGYFKDKDVNQEIAKEIESKPIIQPSRTSLFDAIKARRNDKDVITSSPKVEIDSGSNSNNSMDHYFPDQTQMNIPSNIDNTQVETQPENLNVPNTSQLGLSPILEKS